MQTFFIDLIAMLNDIPALFYFYIVILSLAMGSFFNVVIYRLPLMMKSQWRQECQSLLEIKETATEDGETKKTFNLLLPLSHCPTCKHRISAKDNIPLFSYLWLRGLCRHCKTTISSRYFFIELLTMLLSVAVAMRFGVSWACLAGLFITWLLIPMSFIDIDELFIPDEMVYFLLWGALTASLFGVLSTPQVAIIGALVGYLSLWTIAKIFQLVMRKEGMGHGDFKLMAGLGAWLGAESIPFIALVGSLAGVVIGVSLMVFKNHQRSQPIPFGPFLALAGWIAMLIGSPEQLYAWFAFY